MTPVPETSKKPSGAKSETAPQPENLEEEILRQIGPLVPAGAREQVIGCVLAIVQRYEAFRGPLPHPRHLAEYEAAHPGAADRIIRMAELALDHEIDANRRLIAHEASDRRLGMVLGFAALVIIIGSAVAAGFHGHTALATGLLGVGLVGTIGRFIAGRFGRGDSTRSG